ncbi:uncharacterized protein C15orf41 homolog [Varroa jacobsoni]|uniref:uncharacterized protein C15orf41 homolog n=1 Tax=Varroa jacobsoni TaxID=62625 RepID=UPI000BF34D8C|nr:uncharacterized protein C15orf41 homolog [Varroa jacobsoni]XP_022693941.1 uncharacterized protein C15orf41 homolog [Varroa jacobsoni]XP_022694010.1 uncharacterized protein C15orf41 homolog [Varroa jacobsoni]XP_022694091.1 uncharacterized protein C15orf41 homolog [Varroa jacobsoni]XP_022694165.1 uncharacterized protein C15orf41 homolog [Varroa jacobsoni]XP_022694241.1 uncharacterized protein C15orf41 homolog [Varroa jacobsoni]XP_022694313.1 uncharacterized protein C15orf41 homolog [Varroa j
MLLSEYEEIIRRHCAVRPSRRSLDVLVKEFPHVSAHTLCSIVSTHFTMIVRKKYYLYSNPEKVAEYYAKYKAQRGMSNSKPGFLLKIADELNLSAALMCRFIIEHHLKDKSEPCSKRVLNQLLKDSTKIQDEVLAVEVFLCTLHDPFYGPFSDARRTSVGREFELLLKDSLRSRGIGFVDEASLRKQGYDKTPDIKLEIPAIINGEYVITWIESKASFGDPDSHESYAREQFHSYANRFGPGLVIYWCGFVEELQQPQSQMNVGHSPLNNPSTGSSPITKQQNNASGQFLLADHLPDDIRSMTEFI